MDAKTARIRALNDQLRQNFADGIAVMTPGVAALGAEAVERIVKTIAVFDDFCHANDPHEEHDFGSFEADGQTIYFKIDYFDQSCQCTRPTPPIPPSPSGSSRSCWRRSIERCKRRLLRSEPLTDRDPFSDVWDQLKSFFKSSLSASFPARLAAAVLSKSIEDCLERTSFLNSSSHGACVGTWTAPASIGAV